MVDKKFMVFLLSVVFLVLTVSFASALGVSPAKKIVDFEEGLNFNSEFKVVNTLDRPIKISIDITGELSKYIIFERGNIRSLEANSELAVKYSLTLPKTISRKDIFQGNNDNYFKVKEIVEVKENSIGTSIGLMSLLRVKVPYDSKYISSDLYIYSGDVGTNTIFVIPIENLGIENISKVKIDLDIMDGGNIIEKLKSNFISIVSGERKEIRLVWPTEVDPGEYIASIVVEYDSKTKEFEKMFTIEGRKMSIDSLTVGEILGDAVRFEVVVKNVWNEELKNVYAEIGVYDLNGSIMGSFVTSKESIPKRKEGIFAGYIEVGSLAEGEYNTKLTVRYGNKEIGHDVETTFYENKFVVEGTKFSSNEHSTRNLSLILTGGLLILIIINLIWFFWFKKKD